MGLLRICLKEIGNVHAPHRGHAHRPKLFQIEIVLAIVFLSLMVVGSTVLQTKNILQNTQMSAAVIAATLTEITNAERAQNLAPILNTNALLTKAAQTKADDMARQGYFSHVTPDGRLPWDFIRSTGYDYQYAGENLAVDFFDSASVATAWMNSPTHHANVINPHFTDIGFGIAQGVYEGRPSVFVVEFFGSQMKAPIKS